MDLRSHLDRMGVRYTWSHHDTAYTAQDLAAKEHITGRRVIKPVLVQADEAFVLCALPASCYVDLMELKEELHAKDARIVDEPELQTICRECELGAEPPIGSLFGLPTVMDSSLMSQDQIMFQAGTHTDAITMSTQDFVRLVKPRIARFARNRA